MFTLVKIDQQKICKDCTKSETIYWLLSYDAQNNCIAQQAITTDFAHNLITKEKMEVMVVSPD